MDHKQILHGGLRRQRAALRRPRTPTGTNLLGLVKHAAVIELEYFGETFDRPAEVQLPWAAAGQSEEDNVDMFAAEGESLEDVLEFARRCFAHADATITALGADAPGRVAWWPDDKAEVTLAQIIAHVALDEARGTTCPRGTPTAGPPTWTV